MFRYANPQQSKIWYFRGSPLDYEGLGFKCNGNDNDRSTLLIQRTLKKAQAGIQNIKIIFYKLTSSTAILNPMLKNTVLNRVVQ